MIVTQREGTAIKIRGSNTRRFAIGGAALSVPALAGILLFSGWLDSGAERGSEASVLTRASPTATTLLTPPAEAEGDPPVMPPGLPPPPERTYAPPTHITIKGQEVPLAPGMTVSGGGVTTCEGAPCPSGDFTRVRYDSNPTEAGWSWLVFDEHYTLLGSQIRPEDQDEFQPLLDALGRP